MREGTETVCKLPQFKTFFLENPVDAQGLFGEARFRIGHFDHPNPLNGIDVIAFVQGIGGHDFSLAFDQGFVVPVYDKTKNRQPQQGQKTQLQMIKHKCHGGDQDDHRFNGETGKYIGYRLLDPCGIIHPGYEFSGLAGIKKRFWQVQQGRIKKADDAHIKITGLAQEKQLPDISNSGPKQQ